MGDHDGVRDGHLAAEPEEARRIAALESETADAARRRLTDSMLDGFSLLDATGVHLDVNPALCTMTGFSREELVGTAPPHPYWPPEEYGAIEAAFSRTLTGDVGTFPLVFMRKDGERFPVLVSPAVLRDEAGAMVSAFATVKDMSELKVAEAALAESEQLFRLTFEQAPIGAALAGMDFRFRRVNARLAQMTGYSMDELLARAFPDITHPDDVAADLVEVERLAAGEIEEYAREKRYVRKDGSVAWGDVVVRPVTAADGKRIAFIAMVADISERRRAESALVESEERYAILFENTAEGFAYCEMLYDDAGRPDDFRYLAVNPAFGRLTGLTQVVGRRVSEVFPTARDDSPEIFEAYGSVVETGEPAEFEIDFAPLGMWLHVSARRPRPGHFVAVFSDVSERKRAEQTVQRERDRAQSYLDIAGVMLVAIGADQNVLFANPKACEILGRDERDVVGRNWFDVTLPEEERETIREGFAQLMADNVAPWEYVENRVVTGSGDERLIAWHNTVIRDDDGRIVSTLSSGEDVTERRETERLLAVPAEILAIIAALAPVGETAERVVAALQRATGFDAVGLRLQENDDFPFVASVGYSEEFLAAENTLAERSVDGGLCRAADGSISLECTCGLVIRGATDTANPLFTAGGSAWTNDSLPFLDVPPEDDPRLHPRNRCIHVGFRSLALVPLRAGEEILGLLHLGDRRTDRLTPETVDYFEGLGRSIGEALAKRRAQEALRESEERLHTVIAATHEGSVLQARDGRILAWNPAAEEVFGVSASEVVGESALGRDWAAVHEDGTPWPPAEHPSMLTLATGEPQHDVIMGVKRHGDLRWISINAEPVLDPGEAEPQSAVVTFADVTERKSAEDEIKRLNAELRERVIDRTEQLDAANRELEALAYSIAHDVRAPLRAIDGFSAAVMEDEARRLSPDGVAALRRVRSAAQTLAQLLDDLMGLSHISRRELVRRPVDISALAIEVGEETAADHASRAVDLSVMPGLTADADPGLTRLILRELLGNAWKFTAPHAGARVEVGAYEAGGEKVFFVRDDGIGFDMRYAEHLFGVFQRMHPPEQFEGDGVGLATVQRLVRRHGGRTWAESEPGEGTTIFFTLPSGGLQQETAGA